MQADDRKVTFAGTHSSSFAHAWRPADFPQLQLEWKMRQQGEKLLEEEIDDYIVFFNEQRPAYSLHYLTPKQYREANAG